MSNTQVGILVVLGWIVLLLAEPVAQLYDDATTPQPWFNAEIEVGDGKVIYTREINRWLRGEWSANVQVPFGDRWRGICAESGRYTYRPSTSGTITMTFPYFTGGCVQPGGPHRVCVDYVMTDRRGVTRDFGPFCSG